MKITLHVIGETEPRRPIEVQGWRIHHDTLLYWVREAKGLGGPWILTTYGLPAVTLISFSVEEEDRS